MMPPSGRATKPTANVLKEASCATAAGMFMGKNTVGNISAAAVPYRKKSYHSILVPASVARAILRTKRSSLRSELRVLLMAPCPAQPGNTVIAERWRFPPSQILSADIPPHVRGTRIVGLTVGAEPTQCCQGLG